jgi:site-specific recombinase XerD
MLEARGAGYGSRWLFISERGQPLTRQAVFYIIKQTADRARLQDVHPAVPAGNGATVMSPSGATLECGKHLVRFTDGARESAQDWRSLLLN